MQPWLRNRGLDEWARRQEVWAGLVLILISLVIYSNTLQNDFVWDDQIHIVNNPYIRGIKYWPLYFTESFGRMANFADEVPFHRPLFLASLSIDYGIWKLNPWGYHLTNILLHAANVWMVFLIGRLYLKRFSLSFIAALLFAVHPVHTESVAYISGRTDLLCSLLMLISWRAFLRFREAPVSMLNRHYFASVLFFALALLTKELALVLPILLWLQEILRDEPVPAPAPMRLRIHLPFLALLGVYLTGRLMMNQADIFKWDAASFGSELLLLPIIAAKYAQLLVWPVHLNSMYLLPDPTGFLDPRVLFGAALLILYALLILVVWKRFRSSAFLLIWIVIGLLPVLNPIYIHYFKSPMAERYLYFPSIAFSLLVVMMGDRLWSFRIDKDSRRYQAVIAASLLGVLFWFSTATWIRNQDWKNEYTVYSRMAESSPASPTAYNNLGNLYRKEGKLDEATVAYRKALQFKPLDADIYYNLGLSYQDKGLLDLALRAYQRSSTLKPARADLQNNLGLILMQKGLYGQAVSELNEAVRIQPDYAVAYNNLGLAYLANGQNVEATTAFEEALKIRPNWDLPKQHLADLQRKK